MLDTMVQLAEYQWQPVPSVISKRYYDASLPEAHRTIPGRTLSRNAVPSGIVASRISLLQRFGSGSSDKLVAASSATTTKHDKSGSRTGFGRRLTNRFGHPAVQNTKPDQESFPVNPSCTFIRLNPPQKTFREHHAVAKLNLRTVRSSTQIQLLAEPPHKDASSGGKLVWKSKSYNPMRNRQNSPDIDVLEEVDPAGNKTKFISQTSIFPIQTSPSESDVYCQESKSIPIHTLGSENSFITTSSIRRQSVRDLFADYGIDRPAGLVSKQTSRETEHTLPSEALPGKCHLCGWLNSELYFSCWRCGHNACSRCDEGSVMANISIFGGKNDANQKLLGTLQPSLPPIQPRLVEDEPVKPQSPIVYTNALYTEPGLQHRGARSLSWRSSSLEMPRETSYRAKATTTRLQEKATRLSLLAGSQTTKKVKESPFLLADQQTPQRAFAAIPLNSSHSRPIIRKSRRTAHQLSREYRSSTSSSDEPTCISEGQSLPVHHGKQNSISPSHQQKQHGREDTDKGYAADTSVHDELFDMDGLAAYPTRLPQSSLRSQTNTSLPAKETMYDNGHVYRTVLRTKTKNYSILANSDASMAPQLRSHSSQLWSHLNIFEEKQVPEYVECRGYPRTGHFRHDVTAVDSGAVGECQHCLDDCPCAACQNANHSVRCCTHGDHQPIVHIHHTPQKGVPRKIVANIPISYPPDALCRSDSTSLSPRTSIAAPLFCQTANNLSTQTNPGAPNRPLPRSKCSMQGKDCSIPKPEEPSLNCLGIERPGPSIVETVLNLGKSNAVVPLISKEDKQETLDGEKTSSMPPVLFTYLDIFSRPSRLSHPTSNTVPISRNETRKRFFSTPIKMQEETTPFAATPVAGHPNDQAMRQKTATKSESDSGVKKSLTTFSISQLVNTPSAKKMKHQHLLGHGDAKMTSKQNRDSIEPVVHDNVQPDNTSKNHVPASLPGPNITNPVMETQLKLELIKGNMTPFDDSSNMAPKSLIHMEDSSLSTTDTLVAQDGNDSHTEHQCIWKQKYMESLPERRRVNRGKMDIKGVTVILHVHGGEDLIFKANSWEGGGLRNGGSDGKRE